MRKYLNKITIQLFSFVHYQYSILIFAVQITNWVLFHFICTTRICIIIFNKTPIEKHINNNVFLENNLIVSKDKSLVGMFQGCSSEVIKKDNNGCEAYENKVFSLVVACPGLFQRKREASTTETFSFYSETFHQDYFLFKTLSMSRHFNGRYQFSRRETTMS